MPYTYLGTLCTTPQGGGVHCAWSGEIQLFSGGVIGPLTSYLTVSSAFHHITAVVSTNTTIVADDDTLNTHSIAS